MELPRKINLIVNNDPCRTVCLANTQLAPKSEGMEHSITNAPVATIPPIPTPPDCAALLVHFLPLELFASKAFAIIT
jgi:hypothetical protein